VVASCTSRFPLTMVIGPAFYNGAFGWTIMAMPEMNYTMVSTGPTTENVALRARLHRGRADRAQ